jgi:hypothetical protein
MKNNTKCQLEMALKNLIDSGKVVIGKIRVNDGEKITEYSALSACPEKHREGYLRALETCKDTYIRDVVYAPVFFAKQYDTMIATRE